MTEDKQNKIDIPESIEGYTITLFWGMTIKQIVLVFVATLFVGFAIFNLIAKNIFTMLFMLLITALTLLAILEIKGRNFYRYLLFVARYYKSKPRVLIYHHFAPSGQLASQSKQLVYQQENNSKLFIIMFTSVVLGLLALVLVGIYLYHVVNK